MVFIVTEIFTHYTTFQWDIKYLYEMIVSYYTNAHVIEQYVNKH